MFRNLSAGAVGIKADLAQTIELAARHDFEGIDFSIEEAQRLVATHGIEHLRSLFSNAGVRPGNFGFPVDFRKDEATWRQTLEALPSQAKLAAQLGCLRTATWIMPCDDELTFSAYFARLTSRIRPAAEILAEHGISLGMEFIGPKTLRMTRKHSFVYTMDAMLAVAASIGTGNVGLLLDIWHLYTSHGDIDDVKRLDKRDVVVVHVNDAPPGIHVDSQLDQVRALPGATGVLDLAGFLQALQHIGYDGPVTAEPFDKTLATLPADESAAKTAASMRLIWQQAGFIMGGLD